MKWKASWVGTNNYDTIAPLLTYVSRQFNRYCILDSGNISKFTAPFGGIQYDIIAGFGEHVSLNENNFVLNCLQTFINDYKGNWIFGHFCYDLKNELYSLPSADKINISHFSLAGFFVPKVVVTLKNQQLTVWSNEVDEKESEQIIEILNSPFNNELFQAFDQMKAEPLVDFSDYKISFDKIIHHIKRGDCYELNYCLPFKVETTSDPWQLREVIRVHSTSPFSAFYKEEKNIVICASPERFIKKTGDKIISQPIKGTSAKKGITSIDNINKENLSSSEKERSENIMITDLVRNDLSRIATMNSVKLAELCGLYEFPRVFQLISTIEARLKNDITFTDILKSCFPMGSMTGAPKISVMKIIEETEIFNRGLYSGSIGYIDPNGDFDFNVVIRSIFINQEKNQAFIPAGSAITYQSDPSAEYEECRIKANSLLSSNFNLALNK